MAQSNVMKYLKQTEILVAIAIVGILIVMILPMPSLLLDILLTMSITFAVIILLVSVYIKDPLEFSTFPTVLLIATLFRLSLNVATTRRILLHGAEGEDAAGAVIKAFGQFVVGGNYVVGIIIFLVLVIINFVVITKGSGRVAEVAARFTLDAMPGKQMSIDADLNAGLIDEQTARKRREEIQKQADFYGAMDGASKFVRGDAVAGLIITAINIIGGLIIGVAQHGLSVSEAAKIFTILTVGDGLVSQIPALIVSTAAGIVVTRTGDEEDLGSQLVYQLFKSSKIMFVAGGILFFFALVPGMPKVSFIFLSLLMIGVGYLMRNAKEKVEKEDIETEEESEEETPEEEMVKDLLDIDLMELEIGFNLIPLVDTNRGGTLLNRIKSLRRQIALEMGFIVPPIRIRDNLQIDPNSYVVFIKGVKVATGSVYPDKYLVMNPDGDLDSIDGIPTKEPAFGLDAKWVDEIEKEKAEIEGMTVVDPSTVISTHLTEIIKTYAYELLGRQETQELIDRLKEKYPKLVEDLIPNILDIGIVQRVLQNLLKERVSIRNLPTILETLAAYGTQSKDIEYLTEKVRVALKRQITESLLAADNRLYVFTLAPQIEQMIAKNIQQGDDGREVVMEPTTAQKLLQKLIDKTKEITENGLNSVLVISPPIRYPFRRFVEKFVPNLYVISHNEIAENVQIESLGTVEITDEN
ncbi:flagellar biosynthesis protein FlhA [Deferribacter desulfuricans SSM1]|uniref:Flagellar biosynthesis protein FlhA n=1 Tax=Deferribacter desulfuricans (strain DSM 14783 / JCM 11476 / NBRC 101012 / SSM1) TaxID=639282 RepID=D3PBD5_DEFDS|nr:flagellar biosynthesis protein FlhA [Deferribacter desulfuricans]BAI79908.1 flagellar biosynthesis protein FlhA [Deferribacter desulfuricans SSM1]